MGLFHPNITCKKLEQDVKNLAEFIRLNIYGDDVGGKRELTHKEKATIRKKIEQVDEDLETIKKNSLEAAGILRGAAEVIDSIHKNTDRQMSEEHLLEVKTIMTVEMLNDYRKNLTKIQRDVHDLKQVEEDVLKLVQKVN